MFVTRHYQGYTRDGAQYASGRFLILMQPEGVEGLKQPIRGIVRFVRMRQLGHFMMAMVTIAGHKISLSGTYGADGLTRDVPQAVYDLGVEIPPELVEAWNKGGGWNSAGSEAPAMRQWALQTFPRAAQAPRRVK